MATTIRAQRLIQAKADIEKAQTLASKIAALRELLAVPKVGRQYRRFAHKKLLAFRAAAVGNDELLRRLDQLEERIAFHAESERSRLAKKHKGVPSKPLTTEPVPQVTAPVDIWRKMLAEQQEKQNETQR